MRRQFPPYGATAPGTRLPSFVQVVRSALRGTSLVCDEVNQVVRTDNVPSMDDTSSKADLFFSKPMYLPDDVLFKDCVQLENGMRVHTPSGLPVPPTKLVEAVWRQYHLPTHASKGGIWKLWNMGIMETKGNMEIMATKFGSPRRTRHFG